ncbi:hypothetical protein QEP73_13765 [Pseudomonas defluvii]|nr:hypothetical protein QEP73_13765 [Pseudomonas defluvii]
MSDLKAIEESNALLAVLAAASEKLKEFHAEHDKSGENYLEEVRQLERAMWAAHSKWLQFAEKNFFEGAR